MQRISFNLTNDYDRNHLNYNNELPVIGNNNYSLHKRFESATQISDRHSLLICWVARGIRTRCRPRHSILHCNIFFYVKLFPTIILSWNSSKCIFWYSLNCQIHVLKMKIQFHQFWKRKTLNKTFTSVSWKWGIFF